MTPILVEHRSRMPSILIAVPVLSRPWRAKPLVESVRAATQATYHLLFICSHGDEEEIEACSDTGAGVLIVPWPAGRADYARKINEAIKLSTEAWILTGADDLEFKAGWDTAALDCAARTGALVIGTNDLGNPRVQRGDHATHSLVSRHYIEEHGGTIDGRGLLLCEEYDHNFCDDELIGTARRRGLFTFCSRSEVAHLHPDWGKSEDDEVYRKGKRAFSQDRALYMRRRRMWT